MYDDNYMRRKLTYFYIAFYLSSFGVALLQNWFLYDSVALVLFNSTIWVPQIVKSYIDRNRRGPSIKLACSFMALQSFLPLYLKMHTNNFLDHKPDFLCGYVMLLIMGLQVFVMRKQQTWGPRWFVPRAWRLNPEAHNYFLEVPQKRSRDSLVEDENGGQPVEYDEDEMICVICMNSV
jgi:hypothetical protein